MLSYNNNQLEILRKSFDIPNTSEFIKAVNPTCSCRKLELLLAAFKSGIDIYDLVNCHATDECIMLLIDAKSKGTDIKGLGNEFIDVDLLRKIIKIKQKNPDVDMSFVEDLSLEDCKNFVFDYDLFGTKEFRNYREKTLIYKQMINEELMYVMNKKKK